MSTLIQNFQNSQDISSLDISNQPEMETKKEPKNKRIYIKFSAENLVRLNELYEKVKIILNPFFEFFLADLSNEEGNAKVEPSKPRTFEETRELVQT